MKVPINFEGSMNGDRRAEPVKRAYFVEKAVCGRYIGELLKNVRGDEQEKNMGTNWVGRKEAGSFQRLLAGTAFKDVDASSVVSEDDECTQPCADDLAEDVGEGLEPREPSEDCHPEGYLPMEHAGLSERIFTVTCMRTYRGIYVPT
jgi:hypothetical protein